MILLCSLTACENEGAPKAACGSEASSVASLSEPIFYGAPESLYLALDPMERAAIVHVVTEDPVPALCSGTVIAPAWILTAKHCAELTGALAVIDSPSGTIRRRILSSAVHPSADVALLEIDAGAIDLDFVFPIRADATPVDSSWTGRLVELAGFGSTEEQTSLERRFVVEPIVEVTTESLVVDGKGRSGACLGDSGGPLLLRSPDGSVRVAGVLSSGATNCLGRDVYTRLDLISSWLAEITGDFSEPSPCGGITFEGSCFWDRAVWCESGTIHGEACSDATRCGWGLEGAYRCVREELDPCAGIDAAGVCDGSVARRCDRGTPVSESCNPCGQICVRSTQSGRVECVSEWSHAAP